jgi:hypothetical protein
MPLLCSGFPIKYQAMFLLCHHASTRNLEITVTLS